MTGFVSGGPALPPPPPVRAGGGSPPRKEKSNSNLPPVNDSRNDLLASIRKGTQLKKVTEDGPSSSSPPPEPALDGMAGALMRALAQRNTALKNSGERVGWTRELRWEGGLDSRTQVRGWVGLENSGERVGWTRELR